MGLVKQLKNSVTGAVRGRGQSYYTSGAVRIREGDAWTVEAEVQGSSLYDVELTREGGSVIASCTCPYMEEYLEPCKHVWATVLAADARGYLRGNGGNGRLYLDIDEGIEPADGGFDEEEDMGRGGYNYQSSPGGYSARGSKARTQRKKTRKPPSWKSQLNQLKDEFRQRQTTPGKEWPAGREILYVFDVPKTINFGKLVVEVGFRTRKQNGQWSKLQRQGIPLSQVPHLADPVNRQILTILLGARQEANYYSSYSYSYYNSASLQYQLDGDMLELVLPLIVKTGRCRLRKSDDKNDLHELRVDESGSWEFRLRMAAEEGGKKYQVVGELRRGEERREMSAALALVPGTAIFPDNTLAAFRDNSAFGWVKKLREMGPIPVPAGQIHDFLRELLALPQLPVLDLPEDLHYDVVPGEPRPCLKVKAAKSRYSYGYGSQDRLVGELAFDYDGVRVEALKPGRGIYQPERHRCILRRPEIEGAAQQRIQELGFRRSPNSYYGDPSELELASRLLPKVVRTLLAEGWTVEAEGKLYRRPGAINIQVSSGIDWFELHGTVDFEGTTASLPALLAALKRGENLIKLDDGSVGMLPEDWLKKYGVLAGLGKAEDSHLRFEKNQVGLLDALLASQPEATFDETFAQARDRMRNFAGVKPVDPPAGFVGQLREYQREGLGWLHFLRDFGFGGCLADDMGLGKTVQVLTLLESRREQRAAVRNGSRDRLDPSLVVVPKSLVFNWKQEAARFAPQLRILDHTGLARPKEPKAFQDYDVVLTTYGTLRRDAMLFKEADFDYCILDEAQAVKNANTDSAKAVRLLRGDHRLALSGTPVENHLGELWSLFEFLNPGMLGTASVFRLGGAGARNPDPETRQLLSKALRPFILRRTKDQVAKDLPEKTEQTLYCDLEPAQRKMYQELRDHYRQSLMARIEREGINKAKIMVLEALLRLRQAACHPGLIDKDKTDEASAKLNVLLPQLSELAEEGHKALVFSQFTSLLSIVKKRLDAEGITYEYLDGRTRDRASRVERFQTDPDCKLFLISLKAGGLGLNLTAAEYVFLLDPWWNPAVEAQAIDRTHRIGQSRPVFAYRLIAKDTVEEKVLELQKTKRDLADAIINADNSLIRNLGRDDLEMLLS